MLNKNDLENMILKINNKGYKAYKDIQQSYIFEDFELYIDYVQADPFAPPSRIRVRINMNEANFPEYLYRGSRQVALEDYIARSIRNYIIKNFKNTKGTGNSNVLFIDAGHQEVLKRTAVKITNQYIEARLSVGLPAAGRKVLAHDAIKIFLKQLPSLVQNCLFFDKYKEEVLQDCVYLYEDQELIRQKLKELGLIAFLANNSVLPRKSGISNKPLEMSKAIKFESPETLRVEIETKHHGVLTGMGLPQGITLIVGGGYHGKSTLLKALERGIYNHIKGDGREWVITNDSAIKIRAEDNRFIQKVNITPFIDNLPFNQDTTAFTTLNASGSTSQAANIMEALEIGSNLLLLDEDTSATNFMIRDARMQMLVEKEKEPITPFIDRVKELYQSSGVSCVLVIGGAGDYLDVCDRVIMMDHYKPIDVTEQSHYIANQIKSRRKQELISSIMYSPPRIIAKESFENAKGKRTKISAKGLDNIVINRMNIDLSSVEQLVDYSQTRAIAQCIIKIMELADNNVTLKHIVDDIYENISDNLDYLSSFNKEEHPGDLALPRKYEIAAAINRMEMLKIIHNPVT
ncbi:Isopentenyl-diphosphate Delta-isomerase [Candidatus Syntrophocurvum alkaliphilum]|uniref:Isopentenyl-diphosphate Delta-isomerase n=1 Tax=Candidatus Syntrophocurvum alkaliphilum TaxID=2293317 RepID=A0A6I6DFV8_9FIRM|nr:ABC-ATPase domain-containing protein [Candidatus Syntrophocurvum alkaliphilum]QGT99310.1 Isopentenyl-diphosphate Delta-isomerase [Candidatus Syntrophocurvum alkaliphilum]